VVVPTLPNAAHDGVDLEFQFANVLVFLLLGGITAGLMLGLGLLLRPSNPETRKLSTYECGEPPSGSAWINFNIRFYLIALIFVIFDVEVAFVYPVAVAFREYVLQGKGLLVLTELFIFVGILFVGLIYVWAKQDLEWLKRVARPS
jgi:NADH-quinone oxidoreductase subunit A